MRGILRLLFGLAALLAAGPAAPALNIVFDYTYDTGNFFGGTNSWRRAYLDRAAEDVEARIADNGLRAILPNPGSNLVWELDFTHPSQPGGQTVILSNRSIPTNVVVIFVGARSYGISGNGYEDISYGETGGAYVPSVPNTPAGTNWLYTVLFRGQPGGNVGNGANPVDFGPWGGSLSFANNASWHFDPDPATVEPPPTNTVDFYSVAVHEILHALGLGTSDSWYNKVNGSSRFTGTNAVAAYGGTIPVITSANPQHWVEGTQSAVHALGGQEAALDASLNNSFRKFLTELDWAALKDIGWEILPARGNDFAVLTNRVVRAGSNHVTTLTWRTQPGKSNQVLFATNLAGPFLPVSAPLVATGRAATFTHTNASPRGFFRIRYLTP